MKIATPITRARLTTPPAAAISGIIFSFLLLTSLVLLRISVPANPQDTGGWLTDNSKAIDLALNMVPFAGIAFLWFIGVVRSRLGDYEDRFFSTVFLGSGLLFLGMLFISAGAAGGLISTFGVTLGQLGGTGIYTYGRFVVYEIMQTYTMRMAGVFMISTCTLALRTHILPRWMAFLGLVLALFLLFSMGFFYWAPLVFPLWVLMISIYILIENLKTPNKEQ